MNKIHKLYWDDELKGLWHTLACKKKECEKNRCGGASKRRLQYEFVTARNVFDKTLRQKERAHRYKIMTEMEEVSNDPKKFWNYIKKLGPSKRSKIPMEVYDNDMNIQVSQDEVMNKWKKDFSGLYNVGNVDYFDSAFYETIKTSKRFKEDLMLDPLYVQNAMLNKMITVEDVRKVVDKAKKGKAVGLDKLPNEIFKNKPVIDVLCKLFQLCFESHLVPTVWCKAVVYPISKSSQND